MLVHIAISGGRIAVTLTALHLGRSTIDIGLLMAVFSLLPMVLSIKAGRLIDQIGPWRPMWISVVMVVIGIFTPFIWQSLVSLVIAAVLVGLGHMTFQIAVQRQMGLSSGDERIRNFSWLALAIATSGLVSPLIAGLSIDYLGYRYVFAILAIAPVMCVLVLLRMRVFLKATHIPSLPVEGKQSVLDLLANPAMRKIFTANVLLSAAWDTHMFLVPIYGVRAGLSATTIGFILAIFAAATILVRIFLPMIKGRLTPWQLINGSMVMTAMVFIIYPFFDQAIALMCLSFLMGIGLGSTQPNILELLQESAPKGRAGEAYGLRMSLINGCQVTIPLAFGFLGALIGLFPLFWITGFGLGIGRWFTHDPNKSK